MIFRDLPAENVEPPGALANQAQQNINGSGLACPVRAQKTDALSRVNSKGDGIDGTTITKILGKSEHRNNRDRKLARLPGIT
ncbi:MAG: hypothetical protein P1P81_06880 [Desulfobulbales bacterium]|nr:hypothetical protein [Desulfobulbales bacterium]